MEALRRALRPARTSSCRELPSGMSSRSISLRLGKRILEMPARLAPSTFSLRPPIGKHLPGQRDLAGHREVRIHFDAGQHRRDRRRHRDARRRAVLRSRAGRHVNVDVVLGEVVVGQPEFARTRAQERHRRLRALLHHVAELSGEHELSRSRHRLRLDEDDVAADRRLRHAGRDADRGDALSHFVEEARLAQIIRREFSGLTRAL